ncbi:DUF2232 domain-containing protein [Afipia sp. TerB]
MMTTVLIAIAAGIASATMFASIVSGALVSLVLFYLAPLPLMMAALGWGSATALVGGAVAAIGVGAVFGLPYMTAFALTIALPAWWLGHLALLARPVSNDPQLATMAPTLDWYPLGRILVWVAVFASLTTMSALLTLGTDAETIGAALRRGLMRIVSGGAAESRDAGTERAVEMLARIAPAAATMIAMVALSLNLWLAAKITQTSQRLRRPWPRFAMTKMPPWVMGVVVVAILLSFVGGLAAILSQIISASLMAAYAMTGFATLHIVTQALSGRPFILGGIYAATFFIGWPVIGMIGLGLADAAFAIRERYLAKHSLPAPPD